MNTPDTTRLPPKSCPFCDAVHDAATPHAPGTPPPTPGDLTICISCGEVSQFSKAMTLEPVPESVWKKFTAEQPGDLVTIRSQQAAIRKMNSQR